MFHTSVKTDKNVGSVFHSLATKHQSRNRDQVEVEQVGLDVLQNNIEVKD